MLNVGKLRKGGELYYLNSVAKGVEDYYLGSGEAPGYWMASGAADLGLKGEVGEDALRAVLNARHPDTGELLLERAQAKRDRVPGFDLTFRAPKSVALLHALGDKEASNVVASAHDSAVAAAMGYLERQASNARRGSGGKNKIASKGFIAAAFRHRTSRAGDPLLHTHVLAANLIEGADGRWGALDARQIYLQAKTAGYLYQAHLRAELTRRLGLQWTEVRNGTADIDGIPRSVIRAFSKRRAEIEESLGDPSESSGREAQVATLTTRQSKDYKISPNELLPEWRVRAERLGVDAQTFHGLLNRVDYREPTRAQIRTVESDLASADGLTANRSSFTRREAIQGFCDRLQEGAPIAEIEELADAFLSSSRVIPLSVRADNSREALVAASGKVIPGGLQDRRYSTADMLEVERRVIERALERQLDGSGVADEIVVERALSRRPSLYEDQRELIRRLATSGQGVEVVIGRAGTGKTYALAGAREVWESSGYRVVGCALGAFAAQQLQSGSGIPSFTITSLLQDIEHPEFGGLAPNSVLVIDEAGMVGTRTLERLLGHAEKAGTKVVLVGDDRQLPEIEAGGAFRGIKNRMPATELEQVRRQPMGWERDALEHIREGRSQKAIDSYMANDRIVIKGSSEETRRQLVTDWWATQDDQEPAIMIAARRSEVADLNDRARELMSSAGRLGDAIHIEDRSFAVGDRVMTLRNSRGLGVINGTRATVEVVDAQRVEVTIRDDSGRSVTLPRSYLESGHLTHAYAMTGHKTQGMTTDKAFVLGDETLYKEWAYVAMSRGRNDNRLYVVAANDAEREELGGEVATPEDPVKELVRAVGRSKAQELAVDTFDVESDDVYVRERCIEL